MVFRAAGLPVKLADKNAPADIGRFLNCWLSFAPFDYGKTCACLFHDISHMQHLHSAVRVEGVFLIILFLRRPVQGKDAAKVAHRERRIFPARLHRGV